MSYLSNRYVLLIYYPIISLSQRTVVRFGDFLSGDFIAVLVVNPPEKKLAKRTYVQRARMTLIQKNLANEFLKTKCKKNTRNGGENTKEF